MSAQSVCGHLDLELEDFDYFLHEISLSFWVDITEQDIRDAPTVGDLFDAVLLKMGTFESSRCLTSVAFYRLRRSLISISGVERRSIRPDTPLQGLVPPKIRVAWWEDIETSLRFRLPSLRPGSVAVAAYLASVVLGVSMYAICLSGWLAWEAKFVSPLAIPLFVWWLFRGASRFPKEFPVQTFGDLVRVVVTLNQKKLATEAGGSTVSQAWTAFRELLSAVSGTPVASITRQMSFPKI